jgi:hypothetical protein
MLPFHGQCIALPKQLGPAIHGCGFQSCLKFLADVLVHLFRRDFHGAHQAEIVAHVLEMRIELCARYPTEFVVSLQCVKKVINGEPFLLRADERPGADLVGSHFLEAPLQELFCLLLVCGFRRLAVFLATEIVGAPEVAAALTLEDSSVSPHDRPPFPT